MESSPPSIPVLRSSKKPNTTHDSGQRLARQQAEGEPKRKNIHLQLKPAPLTQWLCNLGEEDSHPASVHSGREERAANAPLFP